VCLKGIHKKHGSQFSVFACKYCGEIKQSSAKSSTKGYKIRCDCRKNTPGPSRNTMHSKWELICSSNELTSVEVVSGLKTAPTFQHYFESAEAHQNFQQGLEALFQKQIQESFSGSGSDGADGSPPRDAINAVLCDTSMSGIPAWSVAGSPLTSESSRATFSSSVSNSVASSGS